MSLGRSSEAPHGVAFGVVVEAQIRILVVFIVGNGGEALIFCVDAVTLLCLQQ